jgi:translation elongation factor P/translation initiation factor 5A
MVLRSQLRRPMAISEGQTYRLVGSEYHPGQGKLGGVTHARLENVGTGTLRDYCFCSELKLQEVAVERQTLEFLSAEGGPCCLMNPHTFEQTDVADGTLDPLCPPSVRRGAPSGRIFRRPAGERGLPGRARIERYRYRAAHAPAGEQQFQDCKTGTHRSVGAAVCQDGRRYPAPRRDVGVHAPGGCRARTK